MKAAKQYKEQWEELNFLRLMKFTENVLKLAGDFLSKANAITHVLLFIFYKLMVIAWRTGHVLLMTEPLVKVEKEETWIYRQIK